MLINQFHVIGLMSGTSLDGVDIAFCEFKNDKSWSFSLLEAETIPYNDQWKKHLNEIYKDSALEISSLDCRYGSYLGELVKDFCKKNKCSPDFISSHGHTVFHQPQNGFTRQIGSGAHLSIASGFPVVCDFRSADVALGGQGAPLVPIGDKLLFPEMNFCLNLGGIANISLEKKNERIAFDICACNMVLNHYAEKKGFAFDENGNLASKGKINSGLLKNLDELPYYSRPLPKSMAREEVEKDLFPLIDRHSLPIEDILATFCVHIAGKISEITGRGSKSEKILLTGGGAFNSFLVKKLVEKNTVDIVIPDKRIIEYKEAIIFAFLGVLRMLGEINCLRTVTGAKADSSSGAVYQPIIK